MSPKSNHYYDLPFKYYIKLHQLLVVHCEKKNQKTTRVVSAANCWKFRIHCAVGIREFAIYTGTVSKRSARTPNSCDASASRFVCMESIGTLRAPGAVDCNVVFASAPHDGSACRRHCRRLTTLSSKAKRLSPCDIKCSTTHSIYRSHVRYDLLGLACLKQYTAHTTLCVVSARDG